MNTEVISSRYAKALLSYVTEAGTGEKVYSQVCDIVQKMHQVPQLREYVLKLDEISLEKKSDLLSAALDEPLAEELRNFMKLVHAHRRMELFQSMLWSFIRRYRQEAGLKVGSLVMAASDDGLCGRLEEILGRRTSSKVDFNCKVDPELIGGFVLELDGYRLDASARSALDRIRRRLVDEGNRIV